MTGTSAGRPPADYGPIQLAEHAQLPRWLIERALAEKLVPGPDVDGRRWSAAVADEVACRAEQIKTTLGTEHPIGANRAAERVAARTGLDVDGDDIRQVAEHGHLHAVDEYKGWPLFDCRDLDELDPGVLDPFIAERVAWHEASCSRYDAAARLGWSVRELQRVAAERGLTPGRFGRYATCDIDDLAADDALDDDVRGNRLLGPDQAAQHLDIRRVDFDYCLAAGWICPHQWVDSQVSRRRTVAVPLYRLADVDALRDIPGLDWEAVRAARPSQPSPLREFASLGTARATLVRGFAADLADKHHIEVTATYDEHRDQWELRWNALHTAPDRDQVRAALCADADLAPHSRAITLRPVEESTG